LAPKVIIEALIIYEEVRENNQFLNKNYDTMEAQDRFRIQELEILRQSE